MEGCTESCGLYYKNIFTIVSDDHKWTLYYSVIYDHHLTFASIVNYDHKWRYNLERHTRGVNYHHNKFIIQATGYHQNSKVINNTEQNISSSLPNFILIVNWWFQFCFFPGFSTHIQNYNFGLFLKQIWVQNCKISIS